MSDIIHTSIDNLARRSENIAYDVGTRSVILTRYLKKTGKYVQARKLLPGWIASLIEEQKEISLDNAQAAARNAIQSLM